MENAPYEWSLEGAEGSDYSKFVHLNVTAAKKESNYSELQSFPLKIAPPVCFSIVSVPAGAPEIFPRHTLTGQSARSTISSTRPVLQPSAAGREDPAWSNRFKVLQDKR